MSVFRLAQRIYMLVYFKELRMNPRTNIKLPEPLAKRIIEFATNEKTVRAYFEKNTAGEGRRYCTLNKFSLELSRDVKEFAKHAYQQLGVSEFIEEHMFGNLIGVNESGGSVHRHQDPRHDNGYYHIRFNFLLQKPTVGGNPIINDVEYEIQEGQSWINYASEWWHASTPVVGNTPRVVLSLGAYVHPNVVETITKKLHDNTLIDYDYSRVIRPQEDSYDIYAMKNLKADMGWTPREFPKKLLKFDNAIGILPRDSQKDLTQLLQIDYTNIENKWKEAWSLGYTNIISLVDIITPHFTNEPNQNISGHVPDTGYYGYPNMWGIMSTFSYNPPEVIFTNVFHELMHWKLLALGFGTGPNTFFPTTREFILNDESELCWSIVNSYADTAQGMVGFKATDRPVSASLHAYVSFLGVAYSYVQFLKINPNSEIARYKANQWGERFEKSFNELLKVGKFTPKGEQLMKGLGLWTADFYKEYKDVL